MDSDGVYDDTETEEGGAEEEEEGEEEKGAVRDALASLSRRSCLCRVWRGVEDGRLADFHTCVGNLRVAMAWWL